MSRFVKPAGVLLAEPGNRTGAVIDEIVVTITLPALGVDGWAAAF